MSLAILYHKSSELAGKQLRMLFNVKDQWPQGRGISDGESSNCGCSLCEDLERFRLVEKFLIFHLPKSKVAPDKRLEYLKPRVADEGARAQILPQKIGTNIFQ